MSASEAEIICIVCARGCRARVREEGGEVLAEAASEGRLCLNGREYVLREFRDPRRVLTTTVRAVDGNLCRLPVRTRSPIPRALLVEGRRAAAALRVRPPVHVGDVIMADLLGTGEDLIATGELAPSREHAPAAPAPDRP